MSDLPPTYAPKTLRELLDAADAFLLLEMLPAVRVARLALAEPENTALVISAQEQLDELLEALRVRLRMTQRNPVKQADG